MAYAGKNNILIDKTLDFIMETSLIDFYKKKGEFWRKQGYPNGLDTEITLMKDVEHKCGFEPLRIDEIYPAFEEVYPVMIIDKGKDLYLEFGMISSVYENVRKNLFKREMIASIPFLYESLLNLSRQFSIDDFMNMSSNDFNNLTELKTLFTQEYLNIFNENQQYLRLREQFNVFTVLNNKTLNKLPKAKEDYQSTIESFIAYVKDCIKRKGAPTIFRYFNNSKETVIAYNMSEKCNHLSDKYLIGYPYYDGFYTNQILCQKTNILLAALLVAIEKKELKKIHNVSNQLLQYVTITMDSFEGHRKLENALKDLMEKSKNLLNLNNLKEVCDKKCLSSLEKITSLNLEEKYQKDIETLKKMDVYQDLIKKGNIDC